MAYRRIYSRGRRSGRRRLGSRSRRRRSGKTLRRYYPGRAGIRL